MANSQHVYLIEKETGEKRVVPVIDAKGADPALYDVVLIEDFRTADPSLLVQGIAGGISQVPAPEAHRPEEAQAAGSGSRPAPQTMLIPRVPEPSEPGKGFAAGAAGDPANRERNEPDAKRG
jgi:hypothetical protein